MNGSPIDRLRDVVVNLRSELRVTRTMFRGEPSYIVRDPITFSANRFAPAEYAVLMQFDGRRTLSEIFGGLVEDKLVSGEHEEAYYAFVLDLQRSGLLTLPVSDDSALYERFDAKRSAARKQKLTGFLSLQLSFFSPDEFLARTIRYFGWMFTRPAFVVWSLLMLVAGGIAISRWSELTAPLLTLLDNANLPWLAAILLLLKFWHEAGHAYACKAFGGKVPDMGALFIVFAPCAYVDASAAWGFQSKLRRMIVSLGGMYFESMVAAVALIVWSLTEPSFLNSLAYQTLMMASVVTVLFNLNPLMKFDGYYVMSDLIEVPNMRQRCAGYVTRLFDTWVLGIKAAPDAETPGMRIFLTLFGIASSIYKVTLVLSICGLIMTKVYFLGFVMAAYYVGSSLWGFAKKSWKRLTSEELSHVRHRSAAFAVGVAVVALVGGLAIPIKPPLVARGVLQPEVEEVVRIQSPGLFQGFEVAVGDWVETGESVATLVNEDLESSALEANMRVASVEKEQWIAELEDPAQALKTAKTAAFLRESSADLQRQLDGLTTRSGIAGRVLSLEGQNQLGRFLHEGDEVARIGAGRWIVELLVEEQTFHASELELGSEISCRLQSELGVLCTGRVVAVSPGGTREIREASLTNVAGGDIVVDPSSGEASSAHFKVTVALDEDAPVQPSCGVSVFAKIPSRPSTVFLSVYRRTLRFLHSLRLS